MQTKITFKKTAGGYNIKVGSCIIGEVSKTANGKWVYTLKIINDYTSPEFPTRWEAVERAIQMRDERNKAAKEKAKKAAAERKRRDKKLLKDIQTGDWEENALNWLGQLSIEDFDTNITDIKEGEWESFTAEIAGDGVRFEMEVSPERSFKEGTFVVDGSTHFLIEDSWYTFDRRGISSSFYVHDVPGFYKPIDEVIQGQLDDIQKSRARHSRSVGVPSLPYTVTPERKEEVTKKLQNGGQHLFNPAGMGVAHLLSAGPVYRGIGGSRLGDPELAKFFGVNRIFITDQDWD